MNSSKKIPHLCSFSRLVDFCIIIFFWSHVYFMSLRNTDSNKSLGYRNRKETGCNAAYHNIWSNHSNVACSKPINLYCIEASEVQDIHAKNVYSLHVKTFFFWVSKCAWNALLIPCNKTDNNVIDVLMVVRKIEHGQLFFLQFLEQYVKSWADKFLHYFSLPCDESKDSS